MPKSYLISDLFYKYLRFELFVMLFNKINHLGRIKFTGVHASYPEMVVYVFSTGQHNIIADTLGILPRSNVHDSKILFFRVFGYGVVDLQVWNKKGNIFPGTGAVKVLSL